MQQHPIKVKTDPPIVYEKQILEAIDQIRNRKARPDADRICNYLLRKFAVDARSTIDDLHRLLEAETVIQVDYKGHTSYRHAAKWSRLQLYKNRPEGFVKEKLNSSMVSGAIAELIVEEPDYLDQGVPPNRLVKQLLDGVSNPTSRRMVTDFLGKEVANGNIARLANGNYSLVATSDMTMSAIASSSTTTSSSSTISISSVSTVQQSNNIATTINNVCSANKNSEQQRQQLETINTNNLCYVADNGSSEKVSTFVSSDITKNKKNNDKRGQLYEFDENSEDAMVTDSASNTSKSSGQSSPGNINQDNVVDNKSKEECYKVQVNGHGKGTVSSEETVIKEDNESRGQESPTEIVESNKREVKTTQNPSSNLKRTSKAVRKQRLLVRAEEPMDIEIKFEKFGRDIKEDKLSGAELGHSDDRSSTNPSPTDSNPIVGVRSARRKRARKVFDPSENNVVKRRRGRPAASQTKALAASQESQDSNKSTVKEGPNRQCSLCSKDKSEKLVACRDCTVRAHPSCIYSGEEVINKANTGWQCERCKTCTVCCETSDNGLLITCRTCDDAYHHTCHTPRVSVQKANSKWQCKKCTEKHSKQTIVETVELVTSQRDTPSESQALPPVLSPQVSPSSESTEKKVEVSVTKEEDYIDTRIPDPSGWSTFQVYDYFRRLFPKEAEAFRIQDIDGDSLLLMKRSDVLRGMDLLLGPALKIYRQILKLQVRRDDPKLYWL